MSEKVRIQIHEEETYGPQFDRLLGLTQPTINSDPVVEVPAEVWERYESLQQQVSDLETWMEDLVVQPDLPPPA